MNDLGSVIKKLLKRRKMWNVYQQNRLIGDWGVVVGDRISSVSRAVKIHNRVLRVAVRDSTWSYHLSLLKPQIIEKINEHAGENIIDDIFFYTEEVREKTIKKNNEEGAPQHHENNFEENDLKLRIRLLKNLIQ